MHVTYSPVHLKSEITAPCSGRSSMMEEWGVTLRCEGMIERNQTVGIMKVIKVRWRKGK